MVEEVHPLMCDGEVEHIIVSLGLLTETSPLMKVKWSSYNISLLVLVQSNC